MRGFFGPEGTFTHQALLTLGNGPAVAFPTVARALDAVRSGDVSASLVPIENSVEGGVTATLDYLALLDSPLQIAKEVVIPVSFDLCVRPGTTFNDIKRIISHPHAVAQVRGWLDAQLPDAVVIERGSTAGAAGGCHRSPVRHDRSAWGDGPRPGRFHPAGRPRIPRPLRDR